MTSVVVIHVQIISNHSVLSSVIVQTSISSDESATMRVPMAGGYQEPRQDCAAGCCSPRPHGGGEGPAAGKQLS